MGNIDLNHVRLQDNFPEAVSAPESNTLPQHRKGERFLKGPIPMHWLSKAIPLSGKELAVAIVLWHFAGMLDTSIIKLTNAKVRRFGLDRYAKTRGLEGLEKAGLVRVERAKGRSPVVTILDGRDDDCG